MSNPQFLQIDYRALHYCCGVQEVGDFDLWDTPYNEEERQFYDKPDEEVNMWNNTGLFISTFVDSRACMRAYSNFVNEHTLLYQSPVRLNPNSGNKLFLCVFLHKDAK